MKLKKLLIIFIMILYGCVSNNNNSSETTMLKDLNKKYENDRAFFGEKLISYFPEKIDTSTITFTEGLSPKFGNLELLLFNKIDKNDLSDITENYEKKAIAAYHANDTCLLVVNKFVTKNNYYNLKAENFKKNQIYKTCYENKYPVPNFWHTDYTTDKTECRLPSDFIIYVLKSASGQFMKKELLTDGWFMPTKWKNGYS
ncbi:MAG: hypothetical protein GXO86_00845, partial [Chlorobi bacterium]|nr:hypothetical protein [Chlorobiota bacterium]